MAVNFASHYKTHIADHFATTHAETPARRQRTPWQPIRYSSMRGFYFLNYLVLILLIVLALLPLALLVR